MLRDDTLNYKIPINFEKFPEKGKVDNEEMVCKTLFIIVCLNEKFPEKYPETNKSLRLHLEKD